MPHSRGVPDLMPAGRPDSNAASGEHSDYAPFGGARDPQPWVAGAAGITADTMTSKIFRATCVRRSRSVGGA